MEAGANDLLKHGLTGSTFAHGALVAGASEIIGKTGTHGDLVWFFRTTMAENENDPTGGRCCRLILIIVGSYKTRSIG